MADVFKDEYVIVMSHEKDRNDKTETDFSVDTYGKAVEMIQTIKDHMSENSYVRNVKLFNRFTVEKEILLDQYSVTKRKGN